MTMLMDGIVKDVEVRRVNRRDGGGEITVYDVVDQDGGKWTAWERELAERAYALKDQPALFKVEIKQNGQYTNRNLRDVQAKPTEGFQPALDAMTNALGSGTPPTTSFTPAGAQEPAQGLPDVPTTDIYIWRQCATKVAAALGGSKDEFWENVATLIEFYRTGTRTDLRTVSTTPGHSQDDDLPF